MIPFSISLVLAIIFAIIYFRTKGKYMTIVPLFTFLGATLMWTVDVIIGLVQDGSAYFSMTGEEILRECLLGLTVAIVGLVIWAIVYFVNRNKKDN